MDVKQEMAVWPQKGVALGRSVLISQLPEFLAGNWQKGEQDSKGFLEI